MFKDFYSILLFIWFTLINLIAYRTDRDRFALLRGPLYVDAYFVQPEVSLPEFHAAQLHARRAETQHAVRIRRQSHQGNNLLFSPLAVLF